MPDSQTKVKKRRIPKTQVIQNADKIINKTRVKFDDKLINYIRDTQPKIEMNICTSEMINGMTDIITHYANTQAHLRNYFKNNKNYNVSGKSENLKMPDYFALGICMICNIINCKSFEDVFNKDDFIISDVSTSENYYDEKDDEPISTPTNCMCSQSMSGENSFIMTNLTTGRSIMVGCDCILKTDIINIEEYIFFLIHYYCCFFLTRGS